MRAINLAGILSLCSCIAKPASETPPFSHPAPADHPVQPTNKACPPAVFDRVRSTDLTSPDSSNLFSTIASETIECQVLALREIASRLETTSHALVIGDFCTAAATLSRFLKPDAIADVKSAYQRFPYHETIHAHYFLGLRQNHIDIRPHLAGKLTDDWSFTSPRQNAQTWHYHLYLASLDDPAAYTKLAEKIAATTDGNDATNLLTSLAELETAAAKTILRTYANDPRRADGPDGPAMKISETVAILLDLHFNKRR